MDGCEGPCNLVSYSYSIPGSSARDDSLVSLAYFSLCSLKELVRSKLVFFIERLVLGNKFDLLQ